jgi:hypothetical protein
MRKLRDALVDLTKEGLVEGCTFAPFIEVVHRLLLPDREQRRSPGRKPQILDTSGSLDSEGHEGNRLSAADNTKRLDSSGLRS